MSEVTRLLDAVESGESQAADELLPLVYEELRQSAVARMANESPGQTRQPTALVQEAWICLLGPDRQPQSWRGRGHFFGAAAEAMRRILVDKARRKQRLKHGEGRQSLDLDALPEIAVENGEDDANLLLVDEALQRLAARDPTKAEVVKLRYFAGLNHAEVAQVLGLSKQTVQRYWQFAKP
ncbi:MAG: sigma-70 family RNA polymerase sigma factor, partial [Verrucomicrobiae bacterium]|nr:sigma-70 family RNA polymerase sigma factor [Verrucomicrobiae bacterium]